MSADRRTMCRQLRKLCGLNRQLHLAVHRAVAAVCDDSAPDVGSPKVAARSVPDLPDAIRSQQAVFSFLVRCLDALGGPRPNQGNPPTSA
jgi:hypothetical protein